MNLLEDWLMMHLFLLTTFVIKKDVRLNARMNKRKRLKNMINFTMGKGHFFSLVSDQSKCMVRTPEILVIYRYIQKGDV